jgi:hypothetical protein
VLAFEVESPVLFEVAVADDCAKGENCFGAVQAPSGPADVKAVGEVTACALDDSRRDRPAGVEGLVVAEELPLAAQVADAGGGPVPLASGQAGSVCLRGDLGGGPLAVAGQDREGLDRDPVLGGGVPGIVQAPRGAPNVLST